MICKNCGHRAINGDFCSEQCETLYQCLNGEASAAQKSGGYVICQNSRCGKEFWVEKKFRNRKKYCNRTCANHARNKLETQKNTSKCESVVAKCPGCQRDHKVFIWWIAIFKPRIFCNTCKKRHAQQQYNMEKRFESASMSA